MSVDSTVLAGRAAAEQLMTDACTITRGSTGATFDETTGTWTVPTGSAVYAGPCKVQTRDVQVAAADVAGREGFVVDWTVHLPVDGTGEIRSGDTVTVTTAHLDPTLVGKTFTVTGPHVGSFKTARRLPVKAEVSSWT